MSDVADYFLDNYGTCALEAGCYWKPGCLKMGWKGRACPHWTPLGARTETELRKMLRETPP